MPGTENWGKIHFVSLERQVCCSFSHIKQLQNLLAFTVLMVGAIFLRNLAFFFSDLLELIAKLVELQKVYKKAPSSGDTSKMLI